MMQWLVENKNQCEIMRLQSERAALLFSFAGGKVGRFNAQKEIKEINRRIERAFYEGQPDTVTYTTGIVD